MIHGWREFGPSAMRPSGSGLCIVMVCTDTEEAQQVGRLLSHPNNGYLITYRRSQDLVLNPPTNRVVLVVLAARDHSQVVARTLQWLRHRWPHCPVTVVGDAGCGEHEIVARTGGAIYLTRPVTSEDWSAILSHAQKVAEPDGAAARKQRP